MVHLAIIWDYDTAAGMLNATKPYNWVEANCLVEHENVDYILADAIAHRVSMTFAVVGFAAEPGSPPFHVNEQLRRIAASGCELASHSWKHEWLPHLSDEQLRLSLRRSKLSLERATDNVSTVVGFVPPHNKPATWWGKGAFSRGDERVSLFRAGSSIGGIVPILKDEGYTWMRVAYVPFFSSIISRRRRFWISPLQPSRVNRVTLFPMAYCGFDDRIRSHITTMASRNEDVVITVSGHPAALSRQGVESKDEWLVFMRTMLALRDAGSLRFVTPRLLIDEGRYGD